MISLVDVGVAKLSASRLISTIVSAGLIFLSQTSSFDTEDKYVAFTIATYASCRDCFVDNFDVERLVYVTTIIRSYAHFSVSRHALETSLRATGPILEQSASSNGEWA